MRHFNYSIFFEINWLNKKLYIYFELGNKIVFLMEMRFYVFV